MIWHQINGLQMFWWSVCSRRLVITGCSCGVCCCGGGSCSCSGGSGAGISFIINHMCSWPVCGGVVREVVLVVFVLDLYSFVICVRHSLNHFLLMVLGCVWINLVVH